MGCVRRWPGSWPRRTSRCGSTSEASTWTPASSTTWARDLSCEPLNAATAVRWRPETEERNPETTLERDRVAGDPRRRLLVGGRFRPRAAGVERRGQDGFVVGPRRD